MHPTVMAMLADVRQAETLRAAGAHRRARAVTKPTVRPTSARSGPTIKRLTSVTALRLGRPAAAAPAPCCA